MTAIAEDLDLAGILGPPCCDKPGCGADAAYIGWWSELCCDRASRAILLCAGHAGLLRDMAAERDVTITCVFCRAERTLERIEPLR